MHDFIMFRQFVANLMQYDTRLYSQCLFSHSRPYLEVLQARFCVLLVTHFSTYCTTLHIKCLTTSAIIFVNMTETIDIVVVASVQV